MPVICLFTGHRELPADCRPLQQALLQQIEALLARGCTDFLSGGAEGFDLLAAETVLEIKRRRPEARLCMVLPYRGQEKGFSHRDQLRYRAILARADLVRYTADRYYKGCLLTRDRVMAEAADYCICYLTRSTGGTAYTVRKAAQRDIPIFNLADLV